MKKILLAVLFTFAFPVLTMAVVSDTDTVVQAAPSSCLNLANNMRYRMTDATTNNEVSALQDFLITKNFLSSEATGYFGAMTFSAVKNYQSSLGWTPTGYVGPLTRAEIKKVTCGGGGAGAATAGPSLLTKKPTVVIRDANSKDFVGLNVNLPSQIFPASKPGEITLAYKVVYKSYSQPVYLGVAYGPSLDLSVSETPGFFPPEGVMSKSGYCFTANVDPHVVRVLVDYEVKESESMSPNGCKLTIGKTYYINLRYPLSDSRMSFGPGETYTEHKFPERPFHFWSAVTGTTTGGVEPAGTTGVATAVTSSTQSSSPSCGSFPAGSCVVGTPTSMTTTSNSYSWGCSAGGVTASCSVERVIEKAPVISSLSAQKLHVVQPINSKTDLIGLAWKGDANTSSCILTGSSGYSKIIPATYYNLSPGNPWTWYDTDSALTQDATYAVSCFSHPSNFPSNILTATYHPASTTTPAPTVSSFTAVSNYVNPGSTPTLTLKWASNATSCTVGASTGFSPQPPNIMTDGVATGSTTISSPQQAMSYTLTCKNSAGVSVPQTITVGVATTTQAPLSISPSSGTFNIGLANPTTLVFALSGATQGDLEGCNEVISHSNPGVTLTPGSCNNSANFFSFSGNAEWKWVGSNLVGTFPYSASMWGAPGIQTKTVFRKKSAPTVQASMTISTTGTLPGTTSSASKGSISVSPTSCVIPVGGSDCFVDVTWSSSNAASRVYYLNPSTNGALFEFSGSANGSAQGVPFGAGGVTTLYLKDGPLSTSNTLSSSSVSISCAVGSTWVTSPSWFCKAN